MAHVQTMEYPFHSKYISHGVSIPWYVHEPWNILFIVRRLWNIHSMVQVALFSGALEYSPYMLVVTGTPCFLAMWPCRQGHSMSADHEFKGTHAQGYSICTDHVAKGIPYMIPM